MGKLLIFYVLALLTGRPLLTLAILLVALYLIDRGTLRLLPDLLPLFRRRAERRRLERAVSINPHDADARVELARLLIEAGRHEPAEAQLREALPKVEEVPEARFLTGLALLRGPRWREAREHLERSLALDPAFRMGEAHLRLGEYWTRAGEHERARAAYETFLERHESSVEGHVLAARGRQAAGDPAGARRLAGAGLAAYRSSPRFRKRLDRSWAWRARSLLRSTPHRAG